MEKIKTLLHKKSFESMKKMPNCFKNVELNKIIFYGLIDKNYLVLKICTIPSDYL